VNELPDSAADQTDGYERVNQKVWRRSEQASLLNQVDTIILDVDGVVIDVSYSFRVAISQTVQLYLTRTIGFTGGDVLVSPSESQLFKLAGGYNNDWDLSAAAIMLYLAKAELLETGDTQELRRGGLTLEEFASAAGRAGGGMHGAMTVLFPLLSKDQRERVETRFNRGEIEELFQELYGGTDFCERLYGHKPEFNKRKGLLNEEKIMLDPEVLKAFGPKVGVLTGRTKEEAEVGLERAGLSEIIPWERVVFDSGQAPELRKPRPGALVKLAGELKAKVTLYVGDVLDDLLVVKNANLDPAATSVFLSAIVVSPLRRAEAALFRREGADIVSLDVNEAIRTLPAGRRA
jgi:HAD superfamily phosphatase